MKKYLLAIVILTISHILQAQAVNFEELGIDSTKYMAKLDSAIKVTPDFGYTVFDSAALMMKLLSPEDMARLMDAVNEELAKYDPYEHISAHLEGGWEVAANSDTDEYYLIKPLRGDKYWVKQLTKTSNDEYYKSSLTLYKIDCKEGMLGVVQTTEYDAKGIVTYSSPTRDDILVSMSYATPDTVGEALVESACK